MSSGRVSPARKASWGVLEKILEPGQASDTTPEAGENVVPLPVLVDEACRKDGLSSEDAALTTEIVYGVLRRQARVQRLLASCLKKPEKLPHGLRVLLLAAAYELLFLDHIPPRATLHQAVTMAKKRYSERMGGLVNGVLRGLDRDRVELLAHDENFISTPPHMASAEDVAAMAAIPAWLAEDFVGQYGGEAAWKLAQALTAKPVPSWRINAAHPSCPAVRDELRNMGALFPVPQGCCFSVDRALTEAEKRRLAAMETEGNLTRQGLGAITAAGWLAQELGKYPEPAEKSLWDACCGRGGKSAALAELGLNVSLCSDPLQGRLGHFKRDMVRLGLPVPETRVGTAEEVARNLTGHYAVILADVPCSGTGTMARNPDVRTRLTPARTQSLLRIQAEILDTTWKCLALGGLLAYMTCSVDKRENEGMVEAFAARHDDCQIAAEQLLLPAMPGQDVLFVGVLRKGGSATGAPAPSRGDN